MRIIFPGDFLFGFACEAMATAFEELGHVVIRLDLRDHFLFGNGIAERLKNRILAQVTKRQYRQAVANAALAGDADLLFTMKGSYLTPAWLGTLRAAGIPSVNYYPDYLIDHNDFKSTWASAYDLFVTTKTFHQPWLETILPPERIAYVPHGYAAGAHVARAVPVRDDDFTWDLCYAGNASPSKIAWMSALLDRCPDVKTVIVGNRWADFKRPNCVCTGPQIGLDYADIIARSRINIAVHAGLDPVNGWEDLVSARSFEIPACGGFMLHIDNTEIRSFYEPGKECDVFSSTDELAAKVTSYLARPTERMAIAAAGHDRAVPAYSYHMRAREITALIKDRLKLS